MLAEMRLGTTLHVSDFADRLLELTRETSAVRAYAAKTGDARLLLRAVEQERATLVTLMARLGITDSTVVDCLGEGRALASAVASVAKDHPAALTRDIADAVSRFGKHDLADALRNLAGVSRALTAQHSHAVA